MGDLTPGLGGAEYYLEWVMAAVLPALEADVALT